MAAGDVTVSTIQPINYDCMFFDGVDDFVSIPFDNTFIDRDFTVSCWFKILSAENSASIIEFTTGSVSSGRVGYSSTPSVSGVLVSQAGTSFATGTISCSVGVWYPVVMTKSLTTLTVYFNNSTTTANLTESDIRGSDFIYLGRNRSVGAYSNMLLRNVRIYNRILTSSEITRLQNDEDLTEDLVFHMDLNNNVVDKIKGLTGTITGAGYTTDVPNLDTSLTALRVTNNDKYEVVKVGTKLMVIHGEGV